MQHWLFIQYDYSVIGQIIHCAVAGRSNRTQLFIHILTGTYTYILTKCYPCLVVIGGTLLTGLLPGHAKVVLITFNSNKIDLFDKKWKLFKEVL